MIEAVSMTTLFTSQTMIIYIKTALHASCDGVEGGTAYEAASRSSTGFQQFYLGCRIPTYLIGN